ncbi:hypothetical protein CWR48_15535 [Oceanobacillus arenosus]|uniref:Uncharacterized protein n=1 Tax=Oceanobacillus arenosus TaxID=1229153 RepID=A0A3D8PPJ2_9BACI|nr:hypothetical protein CWR48_15535 [Oceanobacillus arenosus]
MNLKITSISLEGHEIKVPEGLSELLNNGNGWGIRDKELNTQYTREVIKQGGNLVTKLRRRYPND